MTDKELLELAAKAAGIPNMRSVKLRDIDGGSITCYHYEDETGETFGWNPLIDDGDALRLAVKLGLTHRIVGDTSEAFKENKVFSAYTSKEKINNDPYTATRRAITRAAAEIGKEMK